MSEELVASVERSHDLLMEAFRILESVFLKLEEGQRREMSFIELDALQERLHDAEEYAGDCKETARKAIETIENWK